MCYWKRAKKRKFTVITCDFSKRKSFCKSSVFGNINGPQNFCRNYSEQSLTVFLWIRKSRQIVFANWVMFQHSIVCLILFLIIFQYTPANWSQTHLVTRYLTNTSTPHRDRPNDDYTKMYLNSPVGMVGFVIQNSNSARSTSGDEKIREFFSQ